MTRANEDPTQQEDPRLLSDLAEASAVSISVNEYPTLRRSNPFSQRVTFVFKAPVADVLRARTDFWEDRELPSRTLLARARDLKAAVRTPFSLQGNR